MNHFEKIKGTSYCCIHSLLEDILDNLNIGSDEFTAITVVSNKDLTIDLLKLFMQLDINDFEFSPEVLDIDTIDYDDLYCLDINNAGDISITKAYYEDYLGNDSGYIPIDADLIFAYVDDVEDELLEAFGDNNVLVFDFDGGNN